MTKRSEVSKASVKIASGDELSEYIDMRDAGSIGFTLPAAFTGTHLGVYGATAWDGTYRLLHNDSHTPVGIQNAKAGRTHVVFLAYPYPYIKLGFYTGDVDETTDASNSTQAAEREFVDVVLA